MRKPDIKTIETKIRGILKTEANAISLSNKLFAPGGLFSQIAPGKVERRKMVKSQLFRKSLVRLGELQKKELKQFENEIEAIGQKTTPVRLTVTVPKSLHFALKAEARREGVSISELIRLKASVPYVGIASAVGYGTKK